MCEALNYFLALVMLGFVPTAGVYITVGGVVGAIGSVGTMMFGRLKSAADGLWNFEPDKHRAIVFLCVFPSAFPARPGGLLS